MENDKTVWEVRVYARGGIKLSTFWIGRPTPIEVIEAIEKEWPEAALKPFRERAQTVLRHGGGEWIPHHARHAKG